MIITIYAGEKTYFKDKIYYYKFTCENNNTDKAAFALSLHLRLKDPDNEPDIIGFYPKDNNVKALLEDAKKRGIISDYEIC